MLKNPSTGNSSAPKKIAAKNTGRSAPALPRQSPATTSITPANGKNASGVAAISQRG